MEVPFAAVPHRNTDHDVAIRERSLRKCQTRRAVAVCIYRGCRRAEGDARRRRVDEVGRRIGRNRIGRHGPILDVVDRERIGTAQQGRRGQRHRASIGAQRGGGNGHAVIDAVVADRLRGSQGNRFAKQHLHRSRPRGRDAHDGRRRSVGRRWPSRLQRDGPQGPFRGRALGVGHGGGGSCGQLRGTNSVLHVCVVLLYPSLRLVGDPPTLCLDNTQRCPPPCRRRR